MSKKHNNQKKTKIDRFSIMDSNLFNRVLRKEPLSSEFESVQEYLASGGKVRVLKSKAKD